MNESYPCTGSHQETARTHSQRPARGKLTVFLGYVAGVGKTWAMLQAGQQCQARGIDVVIAYTDTFGQSEAEALQQEFEALSPFAGDSGDASDIAVDAILTRRPQVVLIDDLAHTNGPDARHRKRYQDIEEILDAGIDVYTTLNIQHLESLNDIIAQLTGIRVLDTIPDRILEEANDVILIDLPPSALLKRIKEGKTRLSEEDPTAAPFLRRGVLTTLRELAISHATSRGHNQKASQAPAHFPGEHLLVCIGPDILGERLVRTTKRLANALNAEWSALYVETARHARLSEAQKDQISHILRLAESLGGKVIKLPGANVVTTVIDYAQHHAVTRILVGRPLRPRWQQWIRPTLSDELIRQSEDMDIYIISEHQAGIFLPYPISELQPHRPWWRYIQSFGLIVISTLISATLEPHISSANLVIIYLSSVVIAAIYLGRGPAILASLLGVIAFDFFFVPPSLNLAVEDTEYLLTFLGLLGVGVIISSLAAQVREQVESAQRREVEAIALYALSQDLAIAEGLEAITQAIMANIKQTFGWDSIVLLPQPSNGGSLSHHPKYAVLSLDARERELALWTFHHKQATGQGTETHTEVPIHCLPLKTAQDVIGVLAVRITSDHNLTAEQRRLLKGFALQSALAIERAQLAEAARRTQLLEATERLQTALLNSISHDLRTPLVSITGVLSSLEDEETPLDAETRRSLVETAREEAERLNRLVGNLLNMTRIEGGAMHIIWEPGDIQDVIGSALEQLKQRLEDHPITVAIPPDLPLVPMGFVFIVLVLVNVIENAVKYSPPGSPIEIHAQSAGPEVEIQVKDRGIGIPPDDLEHVFDKFYRVQRPDNVSGTGLGLSIAKGIIEAHGGRIWAQNRPGGGTIVTMTLSREQHNE